MRSNVIRMISIAAVCITASVAQAAGISSISAHGMTYGPGDVIPVFVDSSARNSIMVKGQFMDLCIGVTSNDGRHSPQIGRRIAGSNSAVEILINSGSAPDGDSATITIKFALGEETFRVRAYKTQITSLSLVGKSTPSCKLGEVVTLEAKGSVGNLATGGITGTMLDVADNRYALQGKLDSSTASAARFAVKCTAEGTFEIRRDTFRDSRLSQQAADAMVRGSATVKVSVSP